MSYQWEDDTPWPKHSFKTLPIVGVPPWNSLDAIHAESEADVDELPRKSTALPDYKIVATNDDVFHDNGCQLAPACLTCPFARCKYDAGTGPIVVKEFRQEQALALKAAGMRTVEIAAALGIHKRTAFKLLSDRSA